MFHQYTFSNGFNAFNTVFKKINFCHRYNTMQRRIWFTLTGLLCGRSRWFVFCALHSSTGNTPQLIGSMHRMLVVLDTLCSSLLRSVVLLSFMGIDDSFSSSSFCLHFCWSCISIEDKLRLTSLMVSLTATSFSRFLTLSSGRSGISYDTLDSLSESGPSVVPEKYHSCKNMAQKKILQRFYIFARENQWNIKKFKTTIRSEI